jgi:hypothetical protein
MSRKRHETEQIIAKLREAEVELGKSLSTAEVIRKLEITEATCYGWRKEYGGLRVGQARGLISEFIAHGRWKGFKPPPLPEQQGQSATG